jgi:uridylate kinase
MEEVAEPYIRRKALRHMEKGRVVLFAGGTGNPYFSTDTAAALRAAEIGAEIILMAKRGVDGVYDADPNVHSDAKRYDSISYDEAIQKNLRFMDQPALALCRDNGLPIIVFDINVPGSLQKVAAGKKLGTRVGG